MNERTKRIARNLIERAGRECVQQLLLADTYDKAGQLSHAAACHFNAEAQADFAFTAARFYAKSPCPPRWPSLGSRA